MSPGEHDTFPGDIVSFPGGIVTFPGGNGTIPVTLLYFPATLPYCLVTTAISNRTSARGLLRGEIDSKGPEQFTAEFPDVSVDDARGE